MSKNPMCTNCKDNPVAMGVLHSRGHPSSSLLVWIPCGSEQNHVTFGYFWVVSYRWGIIPIIKDLTLIFGYTWYQYQKKIYPIPLLGCTFWVVSSQYLGERTSSYFAVHQGARNPTAIFARNLSPCGFCLIPHLQWFISCNGSLVYYIYIFKSQWGTNTNCGSPYLLYI